MDRQPYIAYPGFRRSPARSANITASSFEQSDGVCAAARRSPPPGHSRATIAILSAQRTLVIGGIRLAEDVL